MTPQEEKVMLFNALALLKTEASKRNDDGYLNFELHMAELAMKAAKGSAEALEEMKHASIKGLFYDEILVDCPNPDCRHGRDTSDVEDVFDEVYSQRHPICHVCDGDECVFDLKLKSSLEVAAI